MKMFATFCDEQLNPLIDVRGAFGHSLSLVRMICSTLLSVTERVATMAEPELCKSGPGTNRREAGERARSYKLNTRGIAVFPQWTPANKIEKGLTTLREGSHDHLATDI